MPDTDSAPAVGGQAALDGQPEPGWNQGTGRLPMSIFKDLWATVVTLKGDVRW